MPSTDRLRFFTIALSLILSLFSIPPTQTSFASYNIHCARRPEDHSPAYKEGMEALEKGDYKKAAKHFNQAAADKPDDMWAFYYFGLCLLKLKRFDEAAQAYRQAEAIKPMEAAVHYQLGKTYLELGDREAAEKERRWLQERNREMALYLSDLFPPDNPAPLPPDNPAPQQTQETVVPPQKAQPGGFDGLVRPPNSTRSMPKDQRPTILYREKAKYTEIARINREQGTVVLQVVFGVNFKMQDIRVVRGLPDGLTHKAIEAARKITFNPAIKNGEPVSVRGSLEFTFYLY
jgi:TonB family protein